MKKEKILICGILPPPIFGHSAMYKILMESRFVKAHNIKFLNMHFWSYGKHKKVTFEKLIKMIKYFFEYLVYIVGFRPKYVLYNMSWDRMPFLKDFLFCATAIIFGRKLVIHDMGQYVKELYDNSGPIFKLLIRWLLRHTTASIVLGEDTKKYYKGLLGENRIFAVPGSVEDSINIGIPSVEKKEKEYLGILYFSYLAQSKGVYTAFKAAEKICSQRKDVKFEFAGPLESDQVEAELDQLKGRYNSQIEYLGYIGDAEKRTTIFRSADLFIFPTHRDVFGLVLLHAMAEGLAIVASFEGTIPEIIGDGINGILFKKGDVNSLANGIIKLLDDADLRKEIGMENRKRFLNFYAPDIYGTNMIKAFEFIGDLK